MLSNAFSVMIYILLIEFAAYLFNNLTKTSQNWNCVMVSLENCGTSRSGHAVENGAAKKCDLLSDFVLI